MTVALYVRVSTEDQAEQGFSLESQKERLIKYCESQGWDDYEVFMDDGYTGTTLERPALQKLIRAANRKRISRVLVYRLDRLSRKQRDMLSLLEDVFDANGVTFTSATEPFDTSTPLGRAMLGILAVFAQLERDTIIERTKSGLKQRVRQGLWHGANYPFGYVMNQDTGILEIVPEEAALVREAYRKFLDGESRAKIGRWLEQRTTARNINTLFVRRLFTRRTYLGEMEFNGEIYEGQHEPIIDRETFDKVQAKLKGIIVPRGGEKHLLTGLMKCGVCGGAIHYMNTMQNKPNGKRFRYLRVACHNKRYTRTCTNPTMLASEVEAQVVAFVLSANVDVETYAPPADDTNDELMRKLEKRLDAINAERKNLAVAIQKGMPYDLVSAQMEELEKERKAIQAQLDDIEIDTSQDDAVSMIALIKQTQTVWHDLDDDEQKRLLRSFVKTVTIYPNKRIDVQFGV